MTKRLIEASDEHRKLLNKRVCYEVRHGRSPSVIVGKLLAVVPPEVPLTDFVPSGVTGYRIRSPIVSRFARFLLQADAPNGQRLSFYYAPSLSADIRSLKAREMRKPVEVKKCLTALRRKMKCAQKSADKIKLKKALDRLHKAEDKAADKAGVALDRLKRVQASIRDVKKLVVSCKKAALPGELKVAETRLETLNSRLARAKETLSEVRVCSRVGIRAAQKVVKKLSA